MIQFNTTKVITEGDAIEALYISKELDICEENFTTHLSSYPQKAIHIDDLKITSFHFGSIRKLTHTFFEYDS